MSILEQALKKAVGLGYMKWGLIFGFANGIAVYSYYRENRNKYDLEAYQQSVTRYVSYQSGKMAETYIPKWLRSPLFSLFGYVYDVNYDDMLESLENYENFQQFFTRKIKSREFDKSVNKLIVPADSKVLSFCEVKDDSPILVKNVHYKLGYFLTGQETFEMTPQILNDAKKRQNTKLYSVIFYLAPGDYHRYHLPSDFQLKSRSHIVGHLAPVKISYISNTPKVYETNERVSLFGTYNFGLMSIVLVGATNVGSMTLNYDKEFQTNQKAQELFVYKHYDPNILLRKGDELGMFKLGSTVVMMFEAENVKWNIEEGQKCKWGDVFAEVS
ncbi:unnamed protein product [Paramecium primaurelia]|uniref:phosphatidylserine decarboxylase n=1 Tax=Paramecium primaurelia TaxID=5886 RepID=A0A8S1MHW2_PARPR|nr:unnamed protein product [Paramecium primaurelia]